MTGRFRRLRRRAGRDSKSHGFTLIEILVAALLLLFAMAGIVPFFISGLTQASAVRYKSIATNIAREKMEQIRQLDYREITLDPDLGKTLEERFGVSESQRGIDFDVTYNVELTDYETGNLKKVTVDVTWSGTEYVSAASMSTLIHQQYLGPRISNLEIYPLKNDYDDTPFQRLHDKNLGETTGTWIKCHIAPADWGLVFDDLDQPTMAARNVYARIVLFDDSNQPFQLGDPDADYKITDLRYDTADGKVSDVYFYYTFQSTDIPDGYWDIHATAYNEYDEPGNTWRLRVRVENGPPEIVSDFIATPQPDNQTVVLTWYGGDERDRAYYLIRRQKYVWDASGSHWEAVTGLDILVPSLDPNATTYIDYGAYNAGDPPSSTDPWGDDSNPHMYLYFIRAVDTLGRTVVGEGAFDDAVIPDYSTTTTTTEVSETTTTSSTSTTVLDYGWGEIVNTVNKTYIIDIYDENDQKVFTSTIDKYGTLTVEDLPSPGEYKVVATRSGQTIEGSFSMPSDNGGTLFEILK